MRILECYSVATDLLDRLHKDPDVQENAARVFLSRGEIHWKNGDVTLVRLLNEHSREQLIGQSFDKVIVNEKIAADPAFKYLATLERPCHNTVPSPPKSQ